MYVYPKVMYLFFNKHLLPHPDIVLPLKPCIKIYLKIRIHQGCTRKLGISSYLVSMYHKLKNRSFLSLYISSSRLKHSSFTGRVPVLATTIYDEQHTNFYATHHIAETFTSASTQICRWHCAREMY